jgi:hypothetical protein
MVHEPVEIFIGKGVVDHIKLMPANQAEGITGPLPVALMAHHQDNALIFIGKACKKRACLRAELAMPEHALARNSKRLKYLQKKVAEIVEKLFADIIDFLFRFFGEGIPQVFKNYLFTVSNAVI